MVWLYKSVGDSNTRSEGAEMSHNTTTLTHRTTCECGAMIGHAAILVAVPAPANGIVSGWPVDHEGRYIDTLACVVRGSKVNDLAPLPDTVHWTCPACDRWH